MFEMPKAVVVHFEEIKNVTEKDAIIVPSNSKCESYN